MMIVSATFSLTTARRPTFYTYRSSSNQMLLDELAVDMVLASVVVVTIYFAVSSRYRMSLIALVTTSPVGSVTRPGMVRRTLWEDAAAASARNENNNFRLTPNTHQIDGDHFITL